MESLEKLHRTRIDTRPEGGFLGICSTCTRRDEAWRPNRGEALDWCEAHQRAATAGMLESRGTIRPATYQKWLLKQAASDVYTAEERKAWEAMANDMAQVVSDDGPDENQLSLFDI